MNRLAWLYILVLLLMGLGLLGITHAGSQLQAPYAVAGDWHWSAEPTAAESDGTAVRIAQSGQHLVLHVDGMKAIPLKMTRDDVDRQRGGTIEFASVEHQLSICVPDESTGLYTMELDGRVYTARRAELVGGRKVVGH